MKGFEKLWRYFGEQPKFKDPKKKMDYYNQAIEAYRQAVAVDPKYVYPYNCLGNTLYNLGRTEEAIGEYRKAVVVEPTYADSYNGLGNALRAFGRNREAIEAYQKFIDLAHREEDDYWIKRAEGIIAELKR